MRRANGMGSVYKRSERTRQPWVARVRNPSREPDAPKYIVVGRAATKKDALLLLEKYLLNPWSDKHKVTFAALYEEWNKIYFTRISKQTQDNYRAAYKHMAALHNTPFADIRTAQYQNVLNSLDKSLSTKKKIVALLSLLYKYAMENDICDKNYAAFLYVTSDKEAAVKRPFTDDELRLLKSHDDEFTARVLLVLCYTGLRIQELLNLTTADVDLRAGLLRGGLKTDSGKNRVVPIAADTLKYWQGFIGGKVGYIFVREDGSRLTQEHFRRYCLQPFNEKYGLSHNPHECRHTTATLLARTGVEPLLIQQILGHSDYAFTANTYTHENTGELINAINRMANAIN